MHLVQKLETAQDHTFSSGFPVNFIPDPLIRGKDALIHLRFFVPFCQRAFCGVCAHWGYRDGSLWSLKQYNALTGGYRDSLWSLKQYNVYSSVFRSFSIPPQLCFRALRVSFYFFQKVQDFFFPKSHKSFGWVLTDGRVFYLSGSAVEPHDCTSEATGLVSLF